MQTLLVRHALALIALMAVLQLVDHERRAWAEIRLSLADGQELAVDRIGQESDARYLAARVERSGIVMTRKIPWNKVLAVQVDDQPIAVEVLQARYAETSASPPHDPFASPPLRRGAPPDPATDSKTAAPVAVYPRNWELATLPPASGEWPCVAMHPPRFGRPFGFAGVPVESRVIGVRRDPISAYADAAARIFPHGIPVSEAGFAADLLRAEAAATALTPFAVPPQVPIDAVPGFPASPISADAIHSISVDARAGSSQGNVDWDVLELGLQAWDRSGRAVPFRGTLQATLWGQTQRLVHVFDGQFFRRPGRLRRVAEWTRAVDSSGKNPEILTLPFPEPYPAHDKTLFPLATLQVRLLVPGKGRYEATQEAVAVRPVSPFRDDVWRETGSPYLPHELSQGGRRVSADVRYRVPSVLRPDSRILTVEP